MAGVVLPDSDKVITGYALDKDGNPVTGRRAPIAKAVIATPTGNKSDPLAVEYLTDGPEPYKEDAFIQKLSDAVKNGESDTDFDDFITNYLNGLAGGAGKKISKQNIEQTERLFLSKANDKNLSASHRALYAYALSRMPMALRSLADDKIDSGTYEEFMQRESENKEKSLSILAALSNQEKFFNAPLEAPSGNLWSFSFMVDGKRAATFSVNAKQDSQKPLDVVVAKADGAPDLGEIKFIKSLKEYIQKGENDAVMDGYIAKLIKGVKPDEKISADVVKSVHDTLIKNAGPENENVGSRAVYAYALSRIPKVVAAMNDADFANAEVKTSVAAQAEAIKTRAIGLLDEAAKKAPALAVNPGAPGETPAVPARPFDARTQTIQSILKLYSKDTDPVYIDGDWDFRTNIAVGRYIEQLKNSTDDKLKQVAALLEKDFKPNKSATEMGQPVNPDLVKLLEAHLTERVEKDTAFKRQIMDTVGTFFDREYYGKEALTKDEIKAGQVFANVSKIYGFDGKPLAVDGILGKDTANTWSAFRNIMTAASNLSGMRELQAGGIYEIIANQKVGQQLIKVYELAMAHGIRQNNKFDLAAGIIKEIKLGDTTYKLHVYDRDRNGNIQVSLVTDDYASRNKETIIAAGGQTDARLGPASVTLSDAAGDQKRKDLGFENAAEVKRAAEEGAQATRTVVFNKASNSASRSEDGDGTREPEQRTVDVRGGQRGGSRDVSADRSDREGGDRQHTVPPKNPWTDAAVRK